MDYEKYSKDLESHYLNLIRSNLRFFKWLNNLALFFITIVFSIIVWRIIFGMDVGLFLITAGACLGVAEVFNILDFKMLNIMETQFGEFDNSLIKKFKTISRDRKLIKKGRKKIK